MKKYSILIGIALLFTSENCFAVAAQEDYSCTNVMTCAQLGFVQNATACINAGKPVLYCSLDTSKAFCGDYSCRDQGYSETEPTSCSCMTCCSGSQIYKKLTCVQDGVTLYKCGCYSL